MSSKRALGKGLGALLGDAAKPMSGIDNDSRTAWLGQREARMLSLEDIRTNPHQPRKSMDENTLAELAKSIESHGVLQPILVRNTDAGHELVAGERRLRAARIAGLDEIPALVCTMAEAESMRVALLENIQREDLNPIEEAEAYRAIMDTYGATHQELSDMLGKSRSNVSNMLRLLNLEQSIRNMVIDGSLTMGHARALLGLEDGTQRLRLARDTVKEGWSVRSLEAHIQQLTGKIRRDPEDPPEAKRDPDAPALREFETRMFRRLGSPCRIQRKGKKGRIHIEFFSDEELERILEAMGVSSQL